MPTYDYLCTSCSHKFEYFQSMSDDHLKECPVCGSNVRRLVSGGTGLIFKGSGFYLTDYKDSPKEKNKNNKSKKKSDKKIKKEKTVDTAKSEK